MDDDQIVERGGTQEDINKYAHDVGGACGAVYGGTCDFPGCKFNPTPTLSSDEELDNTLNRLFEDGSNAYYRHGFEDYDDYKSTYVAEARAAIKKLLVEARLDEQLNTGTLKFRPDKDGDYGKVYYFIQGEDTVKSQSERIAELQSSLKEDK